MKQPTRKIQPNSYVLIGPDITRGRTPPQSAIFVEPPAPPAPPAVVYWNTQQTAVCGLGTTGSPVTKLAHTFSSLVSQQDADDLALAAATSELVCVPDPANVVWTMIGPYSSADAPSGTTIDSAWLMANVVVAWGIGQWTARIYNLSPTTPITITSITLSNGTNPFGLAYILYTQAGYFVPPAILNTNGNPDDHFIIVINTTGAGQSDTLTINHPGSNSPYIISLLAP